MGLSVHKMGFVATELAGTVCSKCTMLYSVPQIWKGTKGHEGKKSEMSVW